MPRTFEKHTVSHETQDRLIDNNWKKSNSVSLFIGDGRTSFAEIMELAQHVSKQCNIRIKVEYRPRRGVVLFIRNDKEPRGPRSVDRIVFEEFQHSPLWESARGTALVAIRQFRATLAHEGFVIQRMEKANIETLKRNRKAKVDAEEIIERLRAMRPNLPEGI